MYMLAGGGARIRNTSSSRERQPEATMLTAALIASLASRSAAIGGCDTMYAAPAATKLCLAPSRATTPAHFKRVVGSWEVFWPKLEAWLASGTVASTAQ